MYIMIGFLGGMWNISCSGTTVEDTAFQFELQQDTSLDDTTEDTAKPEDSADTNTTTQGLAIVGDYEDSIGDFHQITEEAWSNPTGLFHITQYDNFQRLIIAQNDSGNQFNANKFSKFEWMYDDGRQLMYCQSVLEATSAQEALESPGADSQNMSAGCNGQSWRAIKEAMPIRGRYLDSMGQQHDINAFRWLVGASVFHIVVTDGAENFVLARNDINNPIAPEQWSRLDWTIDTQNDGQIYYCHGIGDAMDRQVALGNSPDHTNIQSGCGGTSWTSLTRQ